MAHEEKSRLLGMSFGTARARLDRDLLYAMAKELDRLNCFRCSKHVERENFSVDHKKNWSVAVDPVTAYFDLTNIAFSHQRCNSGHTEQPEHSKGAYDRGCRCDICCMAKRNARAPYDPAKREQRYLRYGT